MVVSAAQDAVAAAAEAAARAVDAVATALLANIRVQLLAQLRAAVRSAGVAAGAVVQQNTAAVKQLPLTAKFFLGRQIFQHPCEYYSFLADAPVPQNIDCFAIDDHCICMACSFLLAGAAAAANGQGAAASAAAAASATVSISVSVAIAASAAVGNALLMCSEYSQ